MGNFSTASGETFNLNSLGLGDVSAGLHTLTFQGLATADETAFLDNISIATVPEPSTWTAMLLGFGGLSAAMLLRKKRVASNSPVDMAPTPFQSQSSAVS